MHLHTDTEAAGCSDAHQFTGVKKRCKVKKDGHAQ